MAAGDLTNLANVKQYLNIATGSTTDDALLSRLITAATVRIGQYIQRTIGTGTVMDIRNGSGTGKLFLSRWPVTAITSVVIYSSTVPLAVNGGSGYSIPLWDGVSVPIPEPVLSLTGGYTGTGGNWGYNLGQGCFPVGNQNIVVVYTAGFASTPLDIEQACIELVTQTYKQKDRFGVRSVTQAQQTTSSIIVEMLPSVKEALNPYRRVAPLMP